jgi:hypothetical protein
VFSFLASDLALVRNRFWPPLPAALDVVEDEVGGLSGFEVGVVDYESVRVRDVQLAELLGPISDIRELDLLPHFSALGRGLSLFQLLCAAFQPDRNEERFSAFGEALDLAKGTQLVVTHYVGKNIALVRVAEIANKSEHSAAYPPHVFPALFRKWKSIGSVDACDTENRIVYQVVIDQLCSGATSYRPRGRVLPHRRYAYKINDRVL